METVESGSVKNDMFVLRCGSVQMGVKKRALIYCVLSVIIFALIITVIALAVNRNTSVPIVILENDCNDPECYSYASQLLSSINKSADPCDNFYDYACGQWMKDVQVDDTKVWHNSFVALELKINKNLRGILESEDKNSITGKAQKAYKACMNQKNKAETMKKFLQVILNGTSIKGWPILMGPNWSQITNTTSFDDLLLQLAEIRRVKREGILFNIIVMSDFSNNTNNILTLAPPRTEKLPEESRNNFVNDVIKITRALETNFNEDYVNQSAWNMINLMDTLYECADRTQETYHKITIKDFSNQTNINWINFINPLAENFTTFKETDVIAVSKIDYFKNLGSVIENKSFNWSTIIDYEIYVAIKLIIGQQQVGLKKNKFINTLTSTITSPRDIPDWLICVETVSKWFAYELSAEYVNKYYDYEKDYTEIDELVGEIFKTFERRITKLEWLSDEDKQVAKLKLEHMKRRYFYPDWLRNSKNIKSYYEDFTVSDEHIDNFLKWSSLDTKRDLKLLTGQPEPFIEWPSSPMISNAFYNQLINSIFINAAILQPPMFGADRLKAMNYGGLGTIIGHEITHGFDMQGTQFNYLGNFAPWLTNETQEKFLNRAKCYSTQYSKFELTPEDLPTLNENINVNGTLSLSENIADNGGLQQAYWAYKNWLVDHGPERIPDILGDFTVEQIFFISFSQHWCVKYSYSKQLENEVKKFVHSPPKFRILGTLANFGEFSKAFKCRENAKMNPSEKCSLW